ncbi:MAG: hypothetical protein ABIE42_10280 [Candidatus Eisenbacteria bacterium]
MAALAAGALAAFSLLVVGFQLLGILAAATSRPMVTAGNALTVSALLCAAAWSLLWRRVRPLRPEVARQDEFRLRKGRPAAGRNRDRRHDALIIVLFVCAVFLAIAVSSGLSGPPRHWDVLTYHLPRTASWLLHGDLGVYGSTGAFYPSNAELLILALFLGGSDKLVPIVQLPFAFLAALAIYGIGRRFGASVASASIAVLVFLTAPIVFFQTTIAKNDLVVTGLILCFAFFLLRSLESSVGGRGRTREIVAAGFALGLALGTKYSILPFVIVAVPLVFIFHALSAAQPGPSSLRRALGATGILVVALAIPAGFWFVRNLVLTGNPIEPLSMGIREWAASSGLRQEFQFVPARAYWWVFPMMDRHVGSTYSGGAGFGAAFAALALPGVVLFAKRGLDREARAAVRMRCVVVLALIALGVLTWWFGKHHLPRFLLPVMGLACVPVALVLDAVAQRTRAVIIAVVSLAVLFSGLETLRVVFRENHHIWSHQRGASRLAYYRIPEIVYGLPVGTRILLVRPTDHDFYQTYRYPLIASLPGNEVLMGDDVGVGLDISRMSGLSAHGALRDAGINYLFMRTVGLKPFTSPLDELPDLFERVVDTVDRSYPWYRVGMAITEDGTVLGKGTVVTKMYRVREYVPPRPSEPQFEPVRGSAGGSGSP